MKKCPYCDRKIRFWWFKCPVCMRFVWRAPQILLIAAAAAAAVFGVILVVDYFAASRSAIVPKPAQLPASPRRR